MNVVLGLYIIHVIGPADPYLCELNFYG